MFRSTVSGSGDVWPRSAKVSVHSAPLARPSLSSEGICGRLRRRRMACGLLQRQQADIADDGAALGADRFDIDRFGMVEHQPHRIGAAEQRSRGRRGKGERHAQAVAVTPRLDGGGLVLGGAFRRRSWMPPALAASPAPRRWSLRGRHGLRRFRSGGLDLFGGRRALSRLLAGGDVVSGAAAIFSAAGRRTVLGRRQLFRRRQALRPRPRPALRSPGRA